MRSSKSEIFYFILTILVLAAGGFLYVVFGNDHGVNHNLTSQIISKPNPDAEAKPDDKPEDVRLAEEHIDNFDKDLSAENLSTAQAAVDSVTNPEAKETLQNRLNELSTAFDNQVKAEELVAQAEAFLSYPNFEVAQEAVTALTREAKKAELQARLNTVKANLDAYTQANTGFVQ